MKDLNKISDPNCSARRLKTSRHRNQSISPFNEVVLNFIHLRYFPPGLVLQYQDFQGKNQEKVIELLELNCSSNVPRFAQEIAKSEPLLFSTRSHRSALGDALTKLKSRCLHDYGKKYVKKYAFVAHCCPVTKLCLSRDGRRSDYRIFLVLTILKKSKILIQCDHDIIGEGRLVTTSNADNLCSVWDLEETRETALLKGHRKPVTSISMNHFADKILTGSEDGTVRLWELAQSPEPSSNFISTHNSTKQCQLNLAVTSGKVRCAEASSDFSMAASGCSDCTAYVHDLANGVAMYRFGNGHSFDITSIQFDTWGTILLTGSLDSRAALWDLRSGNLISMLQGHKSEIVDCQFDHSCQLVATCSLDSKVRLWDVRMMGGGGGKIRSSCPQSLLYDFTDNDDEILCMDFDSRGNYIASGCKDGTLTAWNTKTGELQFKLQNIHDGPIGVVQWSPNGALLMTASDDKTVNLFHPDMATCIQTITHHRGAVSNACFSYSNEYLVTSGEDRYCIVYRLEKPARKEPFSVFNKTN